MAIYSPRPRRRPPPTPTQLRLRDPGLRLLGVLGGLIGVALGLEFTLAGVAMAVLVLLHADLLALRRAADLHWSWLALALGFDLGILVVVPLVRG